MNEDIAVDDALQEAQTNHICGANVMVIQDHAVLTPLNGAPSQQGCIPIENERTAMSNEQDNNEERPCLHCLIVELIDGFFADHPVASGEPETIDTDEIITAVAKTVAELTTSQNGSERQKIIEQLMREIMNYDAEFRQQDAMGAAGSDTRH